MKDCCRRCCGEGGKTQIHKCNTQIKFLLTYMYEKTFPFLRDTKAISVLDFFFINIVVGIFSAVEYILENIRTYLYVWVFFLLRYLKCRLKHVERSRDGYNRNALNILLFVYVLFFKFRVNFVNDFLKEILLRFFYGKSFKS